MIITKLKRMPRTRKSTGKNSKNPKAVNVKLFPVQFSGKGKIDPELMERVIIQVRDERLQRNAASRLLRD